MICDLDLEDLHKNVISLRYQFLNDDKFDR